MALPTQFIRTHAKRRVIYLALLVFTIAAGLATRLYGHALPGVLANYGGDLLYASFIFFCFRFLLPELPARFILLMAWLFCLCIELLQLWKAPWLQAWRQTRIGGLILGYEFLWSDLICYALGALLGFAVCKLMEGRTNPGHGQ
ncbi:MAG TPA: DUF2809 domain-containing protein [Flavisolibacter sp.]|nr:DUF2809 domain-containing protein [Flavisolibacter sp.]